MIPKDAVYDRGYVYNEDNTFWLYSGIFGEIWLSILKLEKNIVCSPLICCGGC